jgi:hypothetical protein
LTQVNTLLGGGGGDDDDDGDGDDCDDDARFHLPIALTAMMSHCVTWQQLIAVSH